MSTVRVSTQQPYDVHIESGALHRVAALVGTATRVAVIDVAPVAAISAQVVAAAEAGGAQVLRISVPVGEAAKTIQVAADCWSHLAEAGFTRSDVIIGVGGGAVTDVAGFVAATWLRGVGYISVPTTVLGMVDAAVGGKTGLNLPEGKNLVGAFHEPLGVLADLDALAWLPARELSSGLAEVVKAGFVRDAQILQLIGDDPAEVRNVTSARLAQLITRAVSFKAEIVSADLREATSTQGNIGRELLNYGHTLGHAIERFENFGLRHGEAVGLGMVFAAELSHLVVGLAASDVAVHRELIGALGLPTSYAGAPWTELRSLMARDKKTRGARLRFIGLRQLGAPVLIEDPDETLLRTAYAALGRR